MMTTKHLVGIGIRPAITNAATGEGYLVNPKCLTITYESHWFFGWRKVLRWPD